jgi:hypothetical protein
MYGTGVRVTKAYRTILLVVSHFTVKYWNVVLSWNLTQLSPPGCIGLTRFQQYVGWRACTATPLSGLS